MFKAKQRPLFDKIESNSVVLAIRQGLMMVIPVLTVGSIALVLRSLPIVPYQRFIEGFLSGALERVLTFIFNGTFGMLSLYITAAVSLSYAKLKLKRGEAYIGAPITSVACFAIFAGVLSDGFEISSLGVKGMFTALLSAIVSAVLYTAIARKRRERRHRTRIYADGADVEFNNTVSVIFPALAVVSIFGVVNYAVTELFDVSGFHDMFVMGANALFLPLGRSLLSGFLFVALSSLMWFFGIHGSDVFESVVEQLFTPAAAMNAATVAAGGQPTEIFTKTFFDVFVLMGGCGSAICLLIALLLFSRRRNNRRLARMATLPMLFNINELMIFGLPVVYNPLLLIPFVGAPLVCFFLSYAAMSLGLVPLTVNAVEWTTPVLLGGYRATGSIAGSALQLICIAAGVLLYWPFIRLYDKEQARRSRRQLEELVQTVKRSEQDRVPVTLTELTSTTGAIARTLAEDLSHALDNNAIALYYQPQFDDKNKIVGSEALLRWNHPMFGMLYPPLVIKIAEECGQLGRLERYVVTRALEETNGLCGKSGSRMPVCINVSVVTVEDPQFQEFLAEEAKGYSLQRGEVCLEITEQMALQSGEECEELFKKIRGLGYYMAIDDFSMGHTSLKYLQSNQFDLVKLDGALVNALQENPRSREIVSSIVGLSQSLGFSVLAEYVETKEQQQLLKEIGCLKYQGYLCSPALPPEQYAELLNKE